MLKGSNHLNNWFKAGITTLLFCSPSLLFSRPASASEWQDKVTQERLVWFNPKTQQEQINYVRVPDWTRISLADFPGTLRGGSIGDEYNEYVGYDLSRVWARGDKPASFLKLGDIAEALEPQELTIGDIASIAGIDLDTEQTWSKKGRTRTKTTQFNDSPELRHALEDATTFIPRLPPCKSTFDTSMCSMPPLNDGSGSLFSDDSSNCQYSWQTDSLGRQCGGRSASQRFGGK